VKKLHKKTAPTLWLGGARQCQKRGVCV